MLEKEAHKLLEKFHVPEHIRMHCGKVAYLAEKMALRFEEKGVKVDVESVKIAGILHDLFRVVDIEGEGYKELCENASEDDIKTWEIIKKDYEGLLHCQAAAKYFNDMGESKIASIIKSHRFEAIIDEEDKPKTLEEKIVAYADMRVLYSDVVTMQERLDDGQRRYNPNKENLGEISKIHEAFYELEAEIFNAIGEI